VPSKAPTNVATIVAFNISYVRIFDLFFML
jgi:hypothetical protein